MPLSLSELLNPAPRAAMESKGPIDMAPDDVLPTPSTGEYFAPELFQTADEFSPKSKSREESTGSGSDARPLHNARDGPLVNAEGDLEGSTVSDVLIKSEGIVASGEESSTPKNAIISAEEPRRRNTSDSVEVDDQVERSTEETSMKRSNKSDSPPKPRPQKSSTKNEGQHTDKRYLCYLCNKLFTRRRSVRDHLSKIHSTKTWEPARSLEVIVDPATGEPVEPLEAQLYKTAAKPAVANEEDEENDDLEQPAESSPPPPTIATNLKTEASVGGSRASSIDNFTTPAPVIGKKRPAPISANTKKGVARQKNTHTPNKKPKLSNSDNLTNTPTSFRSPSAAPAGISHKPPTSKLKNQSSTSVADSPTPPASSRATSADPLSTSADEDGEPENDMPHSAADTPNTNSDGDVFCICRKGDNHTWMIACDGGCEEWYHGKCVDIRERDGDLIDKYICPGCNLRGVGQTTWKRMCRRKGCRKPARVLHDPPSKYCSADCGRKFFVEMVVKGDENCGVSKNGQFLEETINDKKYRKKRRGRDMRPTVNGNGNIGHPRRQNTPGSDDNENSEYETDSSADDDVLPNRGGALRAGEVRAIVDQCKTIDAWRELGKKPVAPPMVHGLDGTTDSEATNGMQTGIESQLDDFERQRLTTLMAELAKCQQEVQSLEAKEKLLDMIKERSGKITEEVKKGNPKLKDLCGFDPRLSWTDAEFQIWHSSDDGAAAVKSGKLGPPESLDRSAGGSKAVPNGIDPAQNSDGDDEEEEETKMPTKGGVCVKHRCARHGKWAKMQLAEVRFEQDIVNRRMERLKREEELLRGRAVVRLWEQQR